jgi:hypothetical protein
MGARFGVGYIGKHWQHLFFVRIYRHFDRDPWWVIRFRVEVGPFVMYYEYDK